MVTLVLPLDEADWAFNASATGRMVPVTLPDGEVQPGKVRDVVVDEVDPTRARVRLSWP